MDQPVDASSNTDDVVISGISCRLPESDNMKEFRDHLMNGDDMVTPEDNRRWPPGKSLEFGSNIFQYKLLKMLAHMASDLFIKYKI